MKDKIKLSQKQLNIDLTLLRQSQVVYIVLLTIAISISFFVDVSDNNFYILSIILISFILITIIMNLFYVSLKDIILNQDKYIKIKKVLDAKVENEN